MVTSERASGAINKKLIGFNVLHHVEIASMTTIIYINEWGHWRLRGPDIHYGLSDPQEPKGPLGPTERNPAEETDELQPRM